MDVRVWQAAVDRTSALGPVAVDQSTERGGGFGQLCTPKRTGSSRPFAFMSVTTHCGQVPKADEASRSLLGRGGWFSVIVSSASRPAPHDAALLDAGFAVSRTFTTLDPDKG